ncbi:MAG: DNA polymerase-3 subunit delta' [Candidatus Binatia bacterium]|jgi:DNA polymerase-3 subunit delta'
MPFIDFPEQEQVVQLLQRSLERGRLAHAYLFAGSQSVELEAVARTLAMTLNCLDPVRGADGGSPVDCCGVCLSCRKIDNLNHADVHWVRPEMKTRTIGVDQIRGLMQTVNLKPTEAEYKVSIIVAAERMNVYSANAFLKTLEEPPARSILILLSPDPQQLLDTIISRCLRLNFSGGGQLRIAPEELAWIQGFAELAARRDAGLLGRYKLLGNLLERLAKIKESVDETLTERSPLQRHDDVDDKLRKQWEVELTAAIEAEYRRERSELLARVQWWLRDIWIRTLNAAEEMFSLPALAGSVQAVAARVSSEEAMENLAVIERTQRLLGTNVQESLALEVGLLKLKL